MGLHTMFDSRPTGSRHGVPDGAAGESGSGEGSATRRKILEIALALMAQRGVDGTSMRDLAAAAELNVASLYHYFPSKRDLLESVLVEQGFMPVQAPRPEGEVGTDAAPANVAEVLADVLVSVFEVEDFVRLMVGETLRDEPTARGVGRDLFIAFESALEGWVEQYRPDLAERTGADAVARLLGALVLGIFVQHAAGVLPGEQDLTALSLQRAGEAAELLRPPG